MPSPVQPAYPPINDPARPTWHFGPPAQWMNDPNGVIYHEGWWQVYYQHNPHGDEWADMHWGHARSRDLINFEHLPIALHPHPALGEAHCYSGCCVLNPQGELRILYTSVPPTSTQNATQIIATPNDREGLSWTQHVTTPVLDLATHDGPAFAGDWRDPYVFNAEGRTFMILGAILGEEAVIPLYENPDGQLHQWTYRGILLRAPRRVTPFFECPSIIPINGEWVLFCAPLRAMEWHRGALDLENYQFIATQAGRLDASPDCYASQAKLDAAGQPIVLSWARNFPKNRGWNGCLGVPRRVWLAADGLCSAPCHELAQLQGDPVTYPAMEISGEPLELALPGADSSHGRLQFERGSGARLTLRLAGVSVTIDDDGVRFDDFAPYVLPVSAQIEFIWLLDRSLLELFVNDRATCTRIVTHPTTGPLTVTSEGSCRSAGGTAWSMRAAEMFRNY
jgi:beta-fructofuranosidase